MLNSPSEAICLCISPGFSRNLKNPLKKSQKIILFFLLFFAFISTPADCMHLNVDFDEIAQTADIIFIGTVSDISYKELISQNMLCTDITFGQLDVLYRSEHVPDDNESEITLTFAGGKTADYVIKISGSPEFNIGERYLLFALHDGRKYENPLIGGNKGLFKIVTDHGNGKVYPLAAGNAGIVGVKNGKLKKLSRIQKINNGKITRRPRKHQMLTPPRSKGKSPPPVTAKQTPPRKILSLDEFITEIYNTVAGPKPKNPVLNFKRPKIPYLEVKTRPVPKDIQTSNANNSEPVELTEGTDLGWCGTHDLPLVIEQYPADWETWHGIAEWSMWFYNQFMDIYRMNPSDGNIQKRNDENELVGFFTHTQIQRFYGLNWGASTLAICWQRYTSGCPCCEILESDIMFNKTNTWDAHFVNTYKHDYKILFRPVLMHELGHSWGMQRGSLVEDYSYDEPSVMHSYYSDLVEDGFGIHAVDAWAIRDAYDDQTSIRGFRDVGVESYYADAGLEPTTTDKLTYSAGENITVNNITIENMSHVTVQDVQLSLYLSKDSNITTSDIKLGDTATWETFSSVGVWTGDLTRQIPETTEPDTYYVGAIIYYADDDFSLNNTTFLNKTIDVNCSLSDPPTGVVASDETYTDKIRVTWDSSADAEYYEVWRSTTNSSSSATREASGIVGSYYDDYYVLENVTYYYWVKLMNKCGRVSFFSSSNSGLRRAVGSCKTPPNYDQTLIPSLLRQSIQEGFLTEGCKVYRMYLYNDMYYLFSVCSEDGSGGWFSSDGDGDLTMYDSSGTEIWYIDGYSPCGYDATTEGSVYEDWSPPADGYYYLKVSEYGNNQPAGFNLEYKIKYGDYCFTPPYSDETLEPEPFWKITNTENMVAGACRVYEVLMRSDLKYDFTLCSQDGVDATWTSYTDGDIQIYDASGSYFTIDGEPGCRYDASTLNSAIEGYSPPVDHYYYIKVKTHSLNFDATFNLAYIARPLPAEPILPNPEDTLQFTSLETNLSWHGIVDDFDRPYNSYLGGDWTEQTGDMWVAAETVRGNNNSHMTFNSATGDNIGVDASVSASALGFVGLISGYANENNCVFVKVQGDGLYTTAYFYFGVNGSNNNAWNETGSVTLTESFTEGRISTHLDGDTVTLLIDTDFDGLADQSYSKSGIPTNLLGDQIGLGIYGSGVIDNFALTAPADLIMSESLSEQFAATSSLESVSDETLSSNTNENAGQGSPEVSIQLQDNITVAGSPCPTTWDVYLSTENPPETLISANLTEPFCDPTPVPGEILNPCTTYYWRTVKKNCNGETEGAVWSFTTESLQSSDPYPENDAVDVSPHSSLVWNSGIPSIPDEPSAGSVEILENPGFESGSIAPWYTEDPWDWGLSATSPHSGNYDAECSNADWIRQDFSAVDVSDIQSVTLWRRQPGKNRRTGVQLFYLDGTSNYVFNSASGIWTSLDVTSELQAGKFLTGIKIWNDGVDGIDDIIHIDDVSIIANDVPCRDRYNVYLDTVYPPVTMIASGLSETVVEPSVETGSILDPCQNYYWQVETNNCCGGTVLGPVWTFRTRQHGDLNINGGVNLTDFALFADRWLELSCGIPDWCDGTDFDQSGNIDNGDLLFIAAEWIENCP